ncbi:TonB-dependent hemoglobin/transferrin/lactoferrin family receptor [Pasteurella skyensis]|uniref:TonB-dependent hemoglobin/transferrin/lactoferrin family receptor n=1 Tax=Phocoenobacter skyensis TaxID=97481 RepID=A0AAJ6P1W1_9PAST|nr:TonB-dependent hemoglobin/transferrin/lactoferrin family receptor [Pasteurella skyensis]MDP8169945.1 TonB-dependent hemoglobin/transferrin/lactoferrin family receptor [Pasteurella skyensis]MDP8174119.1 TonB-dependent hemoglobin/transferrin/lactoferrin family receptor [Pasteurella skyensis]
MQGKYWVNSYLIAILGIGQVALAEPADVSTLGVIVVEDHHSKSITTEIKTRQNLNDELVHSNRDLVRYSLDLGLADSGRNQKGFSMRGVEANRVGITFDGVDIPSFEENSLYALYSNYNSSRLSIDPEVASNIEIVKGADSFNGGSGSLGGSVNYRSLEVNDLVTKGKTVGGLVRTGYASKNEETFATLGLGYIGEHFDAMGVLSYRQGHELKSAGKGDKRVFGASREVPNPAEHNNNNYLFKLNYHLNPYHHIGIAITRQNKNVLTEEKSDSYSYLLIKYSIGAKKNSRDLNQFDTRNLYYEWTPDSDYLSSVKLDYSHHRSNLIAITSEYSYLSPTYPDSKSLGWDPNPWQIKNRYFNGDLKQLSLNLDSQPLTTHWGEHQLSFKTATSKRYFEVLNNDMNCFPKNGVRNCTPLLSTIQSPTNTKKITASLQDIVRWNETFSSKFGVRYDQTTISVKAPNAPCGGLCLNPIPDDRVFKNWGAVIGLNAQLNDNWGLGYQVGSGFRVPTNSEMYFSWPSGLGNWEPNPNLKAEHSISQTLSLMGKGRLGSTKTTVFYNHYKDFIDEELSFKDETFGQLAYQKPAYQSVNHNKARIYGLELTKQLDLDQVLPISEGWKLLGSLGYTRGKVNNGASLMSIQPLKAVIGLDYDQPAGIWGIASRLSYLGAKKAKDAQVKKEHSHCVKMGIVSEYEWDKDWKRTLVQKSGCVKKESYTKNHTYKYLNKSAVMLDIFGYYKPIQNLTLRGGIYNLFNTKYQHWDSLRGINPLGSRSNSVDFSGKGLERYYAPGRNMSVSVEYKF